MKKLALISILTMLAAMPATAQPSITVGPGGIGVDVDGRDRDRRRMREERDVRTTGSTRRCRTVIRERENSRGEIVQRRVQECE